MVDPAIRQILNNLLSNALRYTPDGGKIEIVLKADKYKLQVTVHDNGPVFLKRPCRISLNASTGGDHCAAAQKAAAGWV
jgi:two-component system OmpR family sensor kinase